MDALPIKRSAIGSASGSIDILGGYAKAAGSLAIRALSEPQATVLVTETSERCIRISSTRNGRFMIARDAFEELVSKRSDLAFARRWLTERGAPEWTYHVLGALLLFAQRQRWFPDEGISFAVASDIPEGYGLCAGMALKIATFRALEKLTTLYLKPQEADMLLARIDLELLKLPFDASSVVAATQGRPGCLVPIDPHRRIAQTPVELPSGITIFSWTRKLETPSNRTWYDRRAAAAAMGWRMARANGGIPDDAPLPHPARFSASLAKTLPGEISGAEFERSHGVLDTPLAQAHPEINYQPLSALGFSVRENRRCEEALHLLTNLGLKFKRRTLESLGDLIWQSHFECREDGLSNPLADEMIEALVHAGPENGVFGARLDVRGIHCTILALAEKKSVAYLRRLARELFPSSAEPFPIA